MVPTSRPLLARICSMGFQHANALRYVFHTSRKILTLCSLEHNSDVLQQQQCLYAAALYVTARFLKSTVGERCYPRCHSSESKRDIGYPDHLQGPPAILFRKGCVVEFSDTTDWVSYVVIIVIETGAYHSQCSFRCMTNTFAQL